MSMEASWRLGAMAGLGVGAGGRVAQGRSGNLLPRNRPTTAKSDHLHTGLGESRSGPGQPCTERQYGETDGEENERADVTRS
jgi:hypothetical protein